MGFLDTLFELLRGQAEKVNDNYNKGYDKAEKLSDEQIKAKLNNSHVNAAEKMGMAQAYKDRNGIE